MTGTGTGTGTGPTGFAVDIAAQRARLLAASARAYTELRRHLHDPWAGYCPVCEVPGPCSFFRHWLDRLAALETAEIELESPHDTRNDTPPDTGEVPGP